ncbi:sulfatase-like hydrolase/transferase [Kitasatospora gansuensis]
MPEADRSDKPAYIRNATATLADAQALRQRQLRTLLSVDDAVQAFHDKLAALGQLDNTLVIYLGDNGYTWADHGWLKKSVPYSPSHQVPFYLSWPAAVSARAPPTAGSPPTSTSPRPSWTRPASSRTPRRTAARCSPATAATTCWSSGGSRAPGPARRTPGPRTSAPTGSTPSTTT